jgi:hypothetical protein
MQAARIRRSIGPVLRTGTFPLAVRREGNAVVVTLASGPSGRERRDDIPCDLFACGFGLVPNVEIARALGCELHAGGIAVDGFGATTVSGVLAAGECTGVGGVDKARSSANSVGGVGSPRCSTGPSSWTAASRIWRRPTRSSAAAKTWPRAGSPATGRGEKRS